MKMVRKGYDGQQFELVNEKTGQPVSVGDTVIDFRGEAGVLDDGTAPHKPSSSGSVYVSKIGTTFSQGSYADVYGLKWLILMEVRDNYDGGVCPDCGVEIPQGFVSQDSCENCGHVLSI